MLFLMFSLSAKGGNHHMSILLVPVGKVDRNVMEWLESDVSRILSKQVFVGKELGKPDDALNDKRNQYLSTSILRALAELNECKVHEKTLGIVDHDLYVPGLNFVFGEASRTAAIISLTRLRQEWYGLAGDSDLFRRRVLTEAVHELGHTYGLSHCRNSKCVMFFSNSLMDTDRKGPEFCLECRRTL
jgi:archaemetzincin